jgi:hypothetical protein
MTKASNWTDLTWANYTSPPEGPEHPAPASTMYLSDQHRTVSLIGGIVEEMEVTQKRCRALAGQDLSVAVISGPFSRWGAQPAGNLDYGIDRDDAPLRQVFLVDCEGVADLLPDVGQKCEFQITSTIHRRPNPDTPLSEGEVQNMMTAVMEDIDLARSNTLDAVDETAIPEERTAAQQEFISSLIEIVYPRLRSPRDEIRAKFPNHQPELLQEGIPRPPILEISGRISDATTSNRIHNTLPSPGNGFGKEDIHGRASHNPQGDG